MKEDPQLRRLSLAQFLEQAQAADGLFATRFYRHPAAVVAWLSSKLGIRPNLLTLASAALTLAASALLVALGEIGWGGACAVLLLLVAGYVFDCADGQLARACGQSSTLGKWLDHTSDCFKFIAVNASLGWVAIRYCVELEWPIGVGYLAMVLTCAGNLTYFFGWNYKVCLVGANQTSASIPTSRSRRLLMLPLHFTDFGLYVLLCLALPFQPQFVIAYLAYGACSLVVYAGYLGFSAWGLRDQ